MKSFKFFPVPADSCRFEATALEVKENVVETKEGFTPK